MLILPSPAEFCALALRLAYLVVFYILTSDFGLGLALYSLSVFRMLISSFLVVLEASSNSHSQTHSFRDSLSRALSSYSCSYSGIDLNRLHPQSVL